MAYSKIQMPGNGTNGPFTVNFALGYLSQSDVTCRVNAEVDGLGAPAYRTITWITATQANISGAAPTGSDTITFERTVSKTVLKHDFQDGAPILEVNLDESHKQALMAAQEALDGRFGALQGDLDVGNHKVINVLDPTSNQDAATKAYVDLQVFAAGAVPAPGAPNIGKVLTALTATTYGWGSPVVVPDGDETTKGKVQFADDTAANAGTSLTLAMSVKKVWDRFARLAGANLFTAVQNITVAGGNTALDVQSASANNTVGAAVALTHNKSVAGAAADIVGRIFGYGKNSSVATTLFAYIDFVIQSATAGAETGQGQLNARVAGALTTILSWANGISVGAGATLKGLGTINVANGLYVGGVEVAGPTAHFEYQTTAGVAGANSVATTWTTGPLTTQVFNNIPGASLSSNQVTLPAGTYRCRAKKQLFTANGRIRLQNITDGTTIRYGTKSDPGGVAVNGWSFIDSFIFTLAGTKVLAQQYYHQVATTGGQGGLTTGGSPATDVERWADIEFEKLS